MFSCHSTRDMKFCNFWLWPLVTIFTHCSILLMCWAYIFPWAYAEMISLDASWFSTFSHPLWPAPDTHKKVAFLFRRSVLDKYLYAHMPDCMFVSNVYNVQCIYFNVQDAVETVCFFYSYKYEDSRSLWCLLLCYIAHNTHEASSN